MSDKELGPCPLCGGKAVSMNGVEANCTNPDCDMPWAMIADWKYLSALAAQNRRRGKALEKLKKWAGKIGYPDWVKLCEEALK